MTTGSRRLAIAALVAAASLASGRARAADDDLDVTIHADARVETTILTNDRRPIRTCLGDCVVRLPRGRYRVAAAGDDVSKTAKRLDLERPVRVDVDPGDKSARTAGLAIGIAGGGVAVATVFVAMVASFSQMCIDCGQHHDFNATPYEMVAASGLAASAIGWTLFATSGTSLTMSDANASAPRLGFGVAPTKGGAFGTIGFAF